MKSEPVKIGIVGLGRWAKVLTRAAQKSDRFNIVAGYSRSEEKRQSYQEAFGIETVDRVPTFEGFVQDRSRVGFVDLKAKGHRAHAEHRHLEPVVSHFS